VHTQGTGASRSGSCQAVTMGTVFVSHSEQEAILALEIALGLEEHGYSTWCYEVDSVPGPSYLVQTGDAIERAEAVILVISRQSLASHQVTREVERAHESRKQFIPLLVDLTHPEFQAAQPTWRQALGTATSLAIVPGDRGATASRLVSGLRALGLSPAPAPSEDRIRQIQKELNRRSGEVVATGRSQAKSEDQTQGGRRRSATKMVLIGAAAVVVGLGGLWLASQRSSSGTGSSGSHEAAQSAATSFRRSRPAGAVQSTDTMPAYQIVQPAFRPPLRAKTLASASTSDDALLGLTLLRLRPATASDESRLLVQEQVAGQPVASWAPVRSESGFALAEGERVRLMIESARSGYLYVIDQETYDDGTLGPPFLIFPTTRTRGGDNRVAPGRLVDIPAETDMPPYFRLTRSRSDHVGELLTFLVVSDPRTDLDIGSQPLRLDADQVEQWQRQWGNAIEQLGMVNAAAQPFTIAEREASGQASRLLTQDEPMPQTIFRFAAGPRDPLLVQVRLRIR
ncbi:MAG: TIR domain-containing protein, partial [Gemmatimonadales bacterium]